jgi:superfamily I DNA/RNA helicase
MSWSWQDLSHWRQQMQQHAIQATWGYCLTVHAAQGSQWSEVGFISCPGFRQKQEDGGRLSAEERRRITYTVVSRAEIGFSAFVLNKVPNYSRKDPYSF